MQEHTKKRPTDNDIVTICYSVRKKDLINMNRVVAPYLVESDESGLVNWDDIFPPLTPGETLRGARLKNGFTQKELAERIGIHANHISSMENNKRSIGKEMARRLSNVLNVDYRIML